MGHRAELDRAKPEVIELPKGPIATLLSSSVVKYVDVAFDTGQVLRYERVPEEEKVVPPLGKR
jgi:hypothetical protein